MSESDFLVLRTTEPLAAHAVEEDGETERIVCSVDPGHGIARRVGTLHSVLPGATLTDFIWSWFGELLIQERVADAFTRERLTGWAVRPVVARFKSSSAPPPPLSEFLPIGWGGVAPPSSGARLTFSCPGCGLLRYSCFTDPTKLAASDRWDGSDFFIVWPLPRFIFVSAKAAEVIRAHEFTGVKLEDPKTLRCDGTLSPGRLSWWFATDRAASLGGAFGIA